LFLYFIGFLLVNLLLPVLPFITLLADEFTTLVGCAVFVGSACASAY